MIVKLRYLTRTPGFPDGPAVKNLPVSAGDARDLGSIPRPGRTPGEGDGNLLQYSCLENPMWPEQPGGLQSRAPQRGGLD